MSYNNLISIPPKTVVERKINAMPADMVPTVVQQWIDWKKASAIPSMDALVAAFETFGFIDRHSVKLEVDKQCSWYTPPDLRNQRLKYQQYAAAAYCLMVMAERAGKDEELIRGLGSSSYTHKSMVKDIGFCIGVCRFLGKVPPQDYKISELWGMINTLGDIKYKINKPPVYTEKTEQ